MRHRPHGRTRTSQAIRRLSFRLCFGESPPVSVSTAEVLEGDFKLFMFQGPIKWMSRSVSAFTGKKNIDLR
jgi:hypothetical protein